MLKFHVKLLKFHISRVSEWILRLVLYNALRVCQEVLREENYFELPTPPLSLPQILALVYSKAVPMLQYLFGRQ